MTVPRAPQRRVSQRPRLSTRISQLRLTRHLLWDAQPRAQRRAIRQHMDFAQLPPRSRRSHGSIWGVTMVRDEVDVLPLVIDHMLAQGVDHLLIADNLSTDGTWEMLQERAAADPRIHVGRDRMVAYLQSLKMTHLAHVAGSHGADWIIPFDADEAWFAPSGEGQLGDFLRRLDADVISANWYDMVSSDDSFARPTETGAESGSTAEADNGAEPGNRAGAGSPELGVATPGAEARFLMDTHPAALGKVAFRFLNGAVLTMGNHTVKHVGRRAEDVLLNVAHARWRSREQVSRKLTQGAEALRRAQEEYGMDSSYGGHWTDGSHAGEDATTRAWEDMRAGRSVALLDWEARGPMREVAPFSWEAWQLP